MNSLALQQKAPNIVLGLVVIAMILALAWQAYDFFTPIKNSPVQSPEPTSQKRVQQVSAQKNIDQYKLFGTPTSQSQQTNTIKTEDLPKTNLRLLLRGVSASAELERASALIEGPNKETLKYAINDTLPGNAKLKGVHEKRIVIERNGRLENLYFPENASIGIVRNSINENESSTQNQPQTRAPQQRQIPADYQRPVTNLDTLSEQRKEEIKHRLEQLRENMKR